MAVALSAFFVFLVGCMSLPTGSADRTAVKEVERQVWMALPVGSTRQEVEKWLTENGIEHSFTALDGLYTRNTFHDANCSGVIGGIVRNTDRTPLVSGSITLEFTFDKEGKLKERSVTWKGTGL